MAGHMGDKYRTQQNLEIVSTDVERGLLFVKGSVPGSKGGWLFVKDSVKVARHADAPFPAGLKTTNTAAADTPAETASAPEATDGQEG
jgi:large subunit ribosomal protein L3